MPVWTAAQINRFTLQAEELFCLEYQCIVNRVALDIVSGTSLYTLPDDVSDIRRITYRGLKVVPFSDRNNRFYFEGMTSSGSPRFYIYNNQGQGAIKFFPTPNENITANQTNLFEPAAIAAQAIIEYYIVPDGIGFALPDYMRRRLLKAYVLSQCFGIEGKGQNLKAAAYWQKKWEYMSETYGNQVYELLTSARKSMVPAIETSHRLPPMAQLPTSMQSIGVDPGE